MMMTPQLLQEIVPSEANDDLHRMIAGGFASGHSMVQIVEDMLELFQVRFRTIATDVGSRRD